MNNGTTISNNGGVTTPIPAIPEDAKFPARGRDVLKAYKETTPSNNGGGTTSAHYVQTIPYVSPDGNSGSFTFPNTSMPVPLKLYSKIHKIITDGVRVGKDGRNDFHKYDYVTEADVVEEMKAIFIKHNIVYDFSVNDVNNVVVDGKEITRVEASITLVDLDSGESKVYTFFGDGQDKGDKGIYKAYTGLQKYFFMKNFLISTGDDPENDSGKANKPSVNVPSGSARRGFTAPTRQTTPTQETTVTATTEAKPALNDAGLGYSTSNTTTTIPTTPIMQTATTQTTQATPTETTQAAPATTEPKRARPKFNPPKKEAKPAREE
jgi:ERF superfamily